MCRVRDTCIIVAVDEPPEEGLEQPLRLEKLANEVRAAAAVVVVVGAAAAALFSEQQQQQKQAVSHLLSQDCCSGPARHYMSH